MTFLISTSVLPEISGITGLGAFMFGINLYGWHKDFRQAMKDADEYPLEVLRNIYPDVFGPIRWK